MNVFSSCSPTLDFTLFQSSEKQQCIYLAIPIHDLKYRFQNHFWQQRDLYVCFEVRKSLQVGLRHNMTIFTQRKTFHRVSILLLLGIMWASLVHFPRIEIGEDEIIWYFLSFLLTRLHTGRQEMSLFGGDLKPQRRHHLTSWSFNSRDLTFPLHETQALKFKNIAK